MKIGKVYRTSKGTFWNRADAEKKRNRAKIAAIRPGDPAERELVQEVFVLIADTLADRGMGPPAYVFELSKVDLK